ncbi:hypothetical protein B0I35DRAFT_481224 [Stachybotrys elegans]|uniref:Xylanolytic transcriptional activator regulatory domain-containing protein n=1 Tax=Stachybotrys elegans TaxID=80388 RepID=A0A8K0SP21_9HYPO|nr:hypothetical protein B0I35DRAFT_481224 [Stachybotrys elegans]
MLFSSCTFVPFVSIQRLGFDSLRSARGEFYRRVKLLYDMDTENSPLPLAQAALLLMAWVPPSNLSLIPYKMWLGRAVQHTKSLNADRVAKDNSNAATKHQKALRRLWWCCVALDRVSPLCTRFNPYLRHDSFNLESSCALISEDLKDEVFRSSVYDPASKQHLLSLFEVYMEFMIILTDVLCFIFPCEESLGSKQLDNAKIDECSSAMNSWLARAMAVIPPSTIPTTDGKKQNLHKSVFVHVNLMYIYYHHSSIALCHTRLLRLIKSNSSKDIETCELGLIRNELQEAAEAMTQLFADLNTHRLVCWLPISALCCLVFPLAFYVVTARLRAANTSLGIDDSNHKNLSVIMETIKSLFPQYDGADLIKETVKYAADLAHAGQALSNDSAPPTSWTQILIGDPRLYLKMVMSIDLSINKGRLAEEDDFPPGLFGNMCLDPWATQQAADSDIVLYTDSSGLESALAQCGETLSDKKKEGTNRIDIRTEPTWGGSDSLDSTIAEFPWVYGSMHATDQLSETIEWDEMPLSDVELDPTE